jgi:hypothetical protein
MGELLSGKLGSIAARTGIDTAAMASAGLGPAAVGAAVQPSLVDLYLSDLTQGTNYVPEIQSMSDAIMAEILMATSPQAAMVEE